MQKNTDGIFLNPFLGLGKQNTRRCDCNPHFGLLWCVIMCYNVCILRAVFCVLQYISSLLYIGHRRDENIMSYGGIIQLVLGSHALFWMMKTPVNTFSVPGSNPSLTLSLHSFPCVSLCCWEQIKGSHFLLTEHWADCECRRCETDRLKWIIRKGSFIQASSPVEENRDVRIH